MTDDWKSDVWGRTVRTNLQGSENTPPQTAKEETLQQPAAARPKKKAPVDFVSNPGRPKRGQRPPPPPPRRPKKVEHVPKLDPKQLTAARRQSVLARPTTVRRPSVSRGGSTSKGFPTTPKIPTRRHGTSNAPSPWSPRRLQAQPSRKIQTGLRAQPKSRAGRNSVSPKPQTRREEMEMKVRKAPYEDDSAAADEEHIPAPRGNTGLQLLKKKVMQMGQHIQTTTGINVTGKIASSRNDGQTGVGKDIERTLSSSDVTVESATPIESPLLSSSRNSTTMIFSKRLLNRAKVDQAAYNKLRGPSFGVTPDRRPRQTGMVKPLELLPDSDGLSSDDHSSLQSVAIRCSSDDEQKGSPRDAQKTVSSKHLKTRDVQIQVDYAPGPLGFVPHSTCTIQKQVSREDGTSSIAREMTLSLRSTETGSLKRTKYPAHSLFEAAAKVSDHLPLIAEDRRSPQSLEQLYLGEILVGTKKEDQKVVKAKNVRAGMGCLALLWHDYKVWRRRRKYRKDTNPFFAHKIRLIEGQFGSGVVSFFIFMRWFLLHNVLLSLLWLLLVVLPQAVDFDYSVLQDNFYVRNILDGQNALSGSWLFYGGYNGTVTLPTGGQGTSYPLSLIYFICTVFSYWGGLFLLLRSMALAYRDEGGAFGAVSHCKFGVLVFASWDYSLTSEQASGNLSMGIANSFKDLHHEEKVKQEVDARSKSERAWIIVRRCLAWILTLLLIVGGCIAIMYIVTGDPKEYLSKLGYSASDNNLLVVYSPNVIFIAFGSILPHAIYQLPRVEKYASGRVELYVTISRVFLLRMAYLLALVAFLYTKVQKGESTACAATLIGQNLYQLIMLDTIKEIVTSMLPSFASYYWTMKKREFQMPRVVLKVVYRQALIWLGMLVCPVMPAVGVLSFLIFFYTHYLVVTRTCEPPSKRWNQPRRSTFFMGLMAATLVVLIVPISLVIGSNKVLELGASPTDGADTCGPFSNRTMITEISLVRTQIANKEQLAADILAIVTSDMTMLSAMFIALSLIYFQHLRVAWERLRRRLTLAELDQERKQSKQLQKRIHQLLQGNTV